LLQTKKETSLFFFSTLDLKKMFEENNQQSFLFAGYLLSISDIRLTLYKVIQPLEVSVSLYSVIVRRNAVFALVEIKLDDELLRCPFSH